LRSTLGGAAAAVFVALLTGLSSGCLNSISTNGEPAVTIRTPHVNTPTFIDPNGKLTSVLTYDSLGRLGSLALPNGIQETYGYDLSSDLSSISDKLGSNSVASFAYTPDPATGRWTSLTDNQGTHSYGYNTNGTLSSEANPAGSGLPNQSYFYDASGNRSAGAANSSTFNAADRLQTDGVNNYVFDGEGNLKSQTPIGGGTATTYTWNSDHQLIGITYPNGSTSKYTYDAFGRRIQVQDPSATTDYAYNGLAVQGMFSNATSLQSSYLPGLETVGAGNTPGYYLSDALGTVRNVTNGSGAVSGSSAYSAWGLPAAGNSTGNTSTFTGYQYDQASGLYYAGARYYNPTTGTFLGEDPVPHANPYPYAANNPVGNIDFLGRDAAVDGALLAQNSQRQAGALCGVAKAASVGLQVATFALALYYPPNNGFLGQSARQWMMPGDQLSRYGSGFGRYASPVGTPIEARALPGGTSTVENVYEVVKPFEVDAGTVAPAFGEAGLGIQYLLPKSVQTLLAKGFLRAITC
jgi:RHS repeat-associated protein